MIYDKLLTKYTDMHGFVTSVPAKESDPMREKWDGENPHLRTGIVNFLMAKAGMFESLEIYNYQWDNFKKTIESTFVEEGLNTRQAPASIYLNSSQFDSISLDEHDGICFSDVGLGGGKSMEILEYGEKYGWCFDEKHPKQKPWPKLSELKDFFVGIAHVLYFAIKTWDFTGSREMDQIIFKYPVLTRMSRVRLHKERAFIRLINMHKPGFYSYLSLVFSIAYSGYKSDVSGHNRNLFRIMALDSRGHRGCLYSLARGYFYRRMDYFYGAHFLRAILIRHLWSANHPVHDLAKMI